MWRRGAKNQPHNYLQRSLKFNYKPYRRPKTLQNTIRSLNYSLFEEEQYEEEYGEEEEFEEDYEEESEEEEEEQSEEDGFEVEEFEDKEEDREEDLEEEDEFEEQSEQEFDERESDEESEEGGGGGEHKSEEESEEQSEEGSEEEQSEEGSEEEQSEEGSEEEQSEEGSEEGQSEEASEEEQSEEEEELKMALVNARSVIKFISRRDGELIDLIENNDLDVLLITETWLPTESLTNSDFRRILPPNYYIIDEPRYYGRGGGVAIVHHKSLICKQVPFHFPSTFEFVAAAVRQPGSKETVLILCIYRPPGGSVTELSNDFLSELHLLLSEIYSRYENVIIGGDFNIWFDCPDMTITQEFEGFMHDNGLVQHVSRPTHQGGHVLDLVLSRPKVRITNVLVRNNGFSDHSTVLFRARF